MRDTSTIGELAAVVICSHQKMLNCIVWRKHPIARGNINSTTIPTPANNNLPHDLKQFAVAAHLGQEVRNKSLTSRRYKKITPLKTGDITLQRNNLL